jgi:dTDP-4-amino-4,6-dideoxygalactose transaminase
LQKAYLDSRYKEENFSVTNELINIVISLPMHTELDNDQQDFIISTILNFIKQN